MIDDLKAALYDIGVWLGCLCWLPIDAWLMSIYIALKFNLCEVIFAEGPM